MEYSTNKNFPNGIKFYCFGGWRNNSNYLRNKKYSKNVAKGTKSVIAMVGGGMTG